MDGDASFLNTCEYAGILAAGIWDRATGGVARAPPEPQARDSLTIFKNIEAFSREVLSFSRWPKNKVNQCYLIELKALSDIIV